MSVPLLPPPVRRTDVPHTDGVGPWGASLIHDRHASHASCRRVLPRDQGLIWSYRSVPPVEPLPAGGSL